MILFLTVHDPLQALNVDLRASTNRLMADSLAMSAAQHKHAQDQARRVQQAGAAGGSGRNTATAAASTGRVSPSNQPTSGTAGRTAGSSSSRQPSEGISASASASSGGHAPIGVSAGASATGNLPPRRNRPADAPTRPARRTMWNRRNPAPSA